VIPAIAIPTMLVDERIMEFLYYINILNKPPIGHIAHFSQIGKHLIKAFSDTYSFDPLFWTQPNLPNFQKFDSALWSCHSNLNFFYRSGFVGDF
jgi:hypothetical protein